MDRPFDLVIYGATGFTGRLACRYVGQNCPTNLKWAVAGRSPSKLEAIVNEIQALNVNRRRPSILIADSSDLKALSDIAKSTRVIVSTAGPFTKYGSLVVQACAENGTHYADITGETPWARDMIQKWHCKPAQLPSIIIPRTATIVEALQARYGPVKIKYVRSAVTDLKAEFSGGTLASSLHLAEAYPLKSLMEAMKPFALSPIGQPCNPTPQPSVIMDKRLGGWIGPWIMSAANRAVVGRTYGLFNGEWGDKFSYREYRTYGSWLMSHVASLGLKIFGICLALSPLRWLLKNIGPAPGSGPSDEVLENGKFVLKVLAETDEPQPKVATITISTEHDIAYLLTGMMLVEAGLTMAQDVKKTKAWKLFFSNGEKQSVVLTPALLGDILKDRINAGGVHFSEVEFLQ